MQILQMPGVNSLLEASMREEWRLSRMVTGKCV